MFHKIILIPTSYIFLDWFDFTITCSPKLTWFQNAISHIIVLVHIIFIIILNPTSYVPHNFLVQKCNNPFIGPNLQYHISHIMVLIPTCNVSHNGSCSNIICSIRWFWFQNTIFHILVPIYDVREISNNRNFS